MLPNTKVYYQGTVWYVLSQEKNKVHLKSINERYIKRDIPLSQIQEINEFSDPYPYE